MSDTGKMKVLAYPSVLADACNPTTCWAQTDLEFEAIVGYRVRQTLKTHKTKIPNKTNKGANNRLSPLQSLYVVECIV